MGCSIESKLEHTSPGPGRTIFSSSFVSLSIIISTLQNPFTYTIPYYKYNSTLFAFSLFSSLLSLLLRNLRTEHNRALQLSLSLMASQASLLLQKQLKGAPYPAPSLTRSTPFPKTLFTITSNLPTSS